MSVCHCDTAIVPFCHCVNAPPCVTVSLPFPVWCSMLLGNAEVPSQGAHVLKIPNGTYEFGANVLDPKVREGDPAPL